MERIRRVEEHVLRLPLVRHERDDAAQPERIEHEARLLPHLAQEALLRRLIRLKVAADPDPLVVVDVVRLLDPMHHQVLAVLLDVAERRQIRLLVALRLRRRHSLSSSPTGQWSLPKTSLWIVASAIFSRSRADVTK